MGITVGTDDPRNNGGKVEIFELSSQRKWNKIAILSNVTDPVHDISFAPNVGRSRHLLAIASKDIHIMALTPTTRNKHTNNNHTNNHNNTNNNTNNNSNNGGGGEVVDEVQIDTLATLSDHESQVWRVEWNLTGTVLSS